jgi:hypothetical protein
MSLGARPRAAAVVDQSLNLDRSYRSLDFTCHPDVLVMTAYGDVGDVEVDLAVVEVEGIGGGRVGKTSVSGDMDCIDRKPLLWVR